MRIAITGATGNLGTALLEGLSARCEVDGIVERARDHLGTPRRSPHETIAELFRGYRDDARVAMPALVQR